jgi:pimeloyl-ACP methyl ester carboxylesterase
MLDSLRRLVTSPFEAMARGLRGPDGPRTTRYTARTRDGWQIALHRYLPGAGAHGTPVLLCHGMGSNRFNLDGPGRASLARHLHRSGYDVWLVELRGAGASRRRLQLPPVPYRWSFEDYAQHDAPAALRLVRRTTGWRRVLWVGHSLGGMVAYATLMTPAADIVAGAVTIASPGMSDVGHETLDAWVSLRRALRFAPGRIPSGTLARLGAPLAGPLSALLARPLRDWGWDDENLDVEIVRFMMRRGVEDLPTSLLMEFARWYEAKRMSDRYDLFSFADHLERIRAPVLLVAGSRDRLTPPNDIERVHERIGSKDKTFVVAGKREGFDHDYSHVDLVLGSHAPDEIYPLVTDWLDAHRPAE